MMAVGLCDSGAVAAQFSDASRVGAGDTVRVRLPGGLPVDASFREWRAELMVLEVDGLASDWPVSIFDMSSLELYTDRTPREGFRHGMVMGAVSGIFVGAATGLLLNFAGVIDEPGNDIKLMADAFKGAGLGIIGGGLVLGFYRGRNPGRGWIQISLPGG